MIKSGQGDSPGKALVELGQRSGVVCEGDQWSRAGLLHDSRWPGPASAHTRCGSVPRPAPSPPAPSSQSPPRPRGPPGLATRLRARVEGHHRVGSRRTMPSPGDYTAHLPSLRSLGLSPLTETTRPIFSPQDHSPSPLTQAHSDNLPSPRSLIPSPLSVIPRPLLGTTGDTY